MDEWKRPNDVMKNFKNKLKKRALSQCFGETNAAIATDENTLMEYPPNKRKNPFRRLEPTTLKKVSEENSTSTCESGIDVINRGQSQSSVGSGTFPTPLKSFDNLLWLLDKEPPKAKTVKLTQRKEQLEIDWSLKSKIRFMSAKPFSWNSKLRTCEEASGVTGFVRCLDTSRSDCSIDTSPNARFHQCCQYWQHPYLPWLELFPRNAPPKVNTSMSAAQTAIASLLQTDWEKAFRSLFQLITTKQCPYFYFISNQFYCLFRASGMGGISETHAIITPTTSGFRKTLETEDIDFTMPLKRKRTSDLGLSLSSMDSSIREDDIDEDDPEEEGELLESILEDANSRKFVKTQRESEIGDRGDGLDESLILVKGVETQALFNILVNCKTLSSNYGSMMGIPPTLLSPTAFTMATLRTLKVKNGFLHVNGTKFYSVEVEGPILPQSLQEMCHLLDQDKIEYSATLVTVKQTKGFTNFLAEMSDINEKMTISGSSVFLKANLNDCGLTDRLIQTFCDEDTSKYGVIECIEPSGL